MEKLSSNRNRTDDVQEHEHKFRGTINNRCIRIHISSLMLKQIIIPGSKQAIHCDVSTDKARPYIPKSKRTQVMKKMHDISHPGAKGMTKLMIERFVWPSMKKDCTDFAQRCLQCQRSIVIVQAHRWSIPTHKYRSHRTNATIEWEQILPNNHRSLHQMARRNSNW